MSRMGSNVFTRRALLAGIGGIGVGLPLLQSLDAVGQTMMEFPKRFIVFFRPNGTKTRDWFPTPGATPSDFTLGRIHAQALAPFIRDLVFLSGIDMIAADMGPGEMHQRGMGDALTGIALLHGDFVGGDGTPGAGWGGGISVDQRIAREIGRSTPLQSLELGVRATGAEVSHRISYAGAGQPLPPENDPSAVFQRLFAGYSRAPTALQQLRAQRKSVLDTVRDQFAGVERRVSASERIKLEQHLTLVRDLEGRLQATMVWGDACRVPGAPMSMPVDDENTMPSIARLQLDLMVMALACDITRVASIQFSNADNHIRFPWINSLGDGHGLSHAGDDDAAAHEELVERDIWYAQQFAYLLGALKAIPEGDGTMLDNTLILWCSELSIGNIHSHINMPFLLAGRAGGALATGRYLQYQSPPHNDLLLSILRMFGIQDATFGDPMFSMGVLPNLMS
jgi:uncharacterized protein DUF1552